MWPMVLMRKLRMTGLRHTAALPTPGFGDTMV